MRVLDYEFRVDAQPIVRDEKRSPLKHFNVLFSLYCPRCEFEDFIKIDNNHQAGPLKPSNPAT